jgi:hypothetical protein
MTEQQIAAANAEGRAAADFALRMKLALVASSQNPGPVDPKAPDQVALRAALVRYAGRVAA